MKKLFFTVLLTLLSGVTISAQKSDPTVSKLYSHYIQIKNALAADNAHRSALAAENFIKVAGTIDAKLLSEGNISTLRKDATAISESRTIQKQRQYFYNLSDNMILLAGKFKLTDTTVFVQYCPMADGSWLSNERKIVNPYYGSSMLSCGTVKSEVNH